MRGEQAPFTRESVAFLAGLVRHNNRQWFEARRPVYERAIRQPMLDFIDAVSAELVRCAPEYIRRADKLMMRIYRDTRFSVDKTPYKTHAAAWWGHRCLPRTSGAGFYFHLSAEECTTGAGVFRPDRRQLLAIRTAMLTGYRAFADELSLLAQAGMARHESPVLSRNPKGFPKEHAASALIRQAQWGCSARSGVAEALQPGYAAVVANRFCLAANLVRLLNRPLVDSTYEIS